MIKWESFRGIVERLKKEGRFPSLEDFVSAMVEGQSEYAKQIIAWREYHQIGATDTKTDTGGLEQETSDNEKCRKHRQIM